MRNECAWPQQCWESCANGSNIVALRFGDHWTKEMLGVVGWKVYTGFNFAQQHATTSNNMQQGVQTDATLTSNNVGSCWPTMLRPFARGLKASVRIKHFHSRGQYLCKCIGTKQGFNIRKKVRFPEDRSGTPRWPTFYCFGTPKWWTWHHVKRLYRNIYGASDCAGC